MPENDEDFIDVEIDWVETVEYTSTIRVSRESYDEWFEAEVGDKTDPENKFAPGWVREYIDAGEETDWFEQCSPTSDGTAITDRSITAARALGES